MTCSINAGRSRKPLVIHLLRGVGGMALLFAALHFAGTTPLLALLLAAGALVALRGCPTCYLIGLVEILSHDGTAGKADPTQPQTRSERLLPL